MLAPILSQEEELHWLALRLVPGLGARKAGQLVERFRTPQAIFRASRSELEGVGIAGGVAQSIASGCSFEDAVLQQQKMLETAVSLVALSDSRYPIPQSAVIQVERRVDPGQHPATSHMCHGPSGALGPRSHPVPWTSARTHDAICLNHISPHGPG